MAIRVRHHVNPQRAGLLSIAPQRLELLPGPLEIELGCADAQFLFQLAEGDRKAQYVGIEIRRPLVEDVNRRAEASGLPHLRAVHAHINVDLETLLAGHRVRRFYINFPDPWFKRAQQKRRLLSPQTAELGTQLVNFLMPGGELFFQTDIFDLALDAMSVLETLPGLDNVAGEWSFCRSNPYPARSLREERVIAEGQPIWRMLYRRAPSAKAEHFFAESLCPYP
jgi:tRNA (guanine-N7-)-methyltransferase